MTTRAIFDPIYGFIHLPKELFSIIDHPIFQRLDRIRQCGMVSHVYPSATQSRKAHSFGVAYLTRKWAQHLDPTIDQATLNNLTIAALCHDIGHGPFSHLFDHLQVALGVRETHEERSVRFLKEINEMVGMDYTTMLEIECMITGQLGTQRDKPWLYQLVSNPVNGLDTDRFDYLIRDSYYTIQLIDKSLIERIIYNSYLDEGHIIYKSKIMDDIMHLYKARYDMFNRVYCHTTVMKFETILIAAFKLGVHAIKWLDDYDNLIRMDDISLLSILRNHPYTAPYIDLLEHHKFLPDGPYTYTLCIGYSKSQHNPLMNVEFRDAEGRYVEGHTFDTPILFSQSRTVNYGFLYTEND